MIMTLSKSQTAILHVAKNQLSIDDDTYRTILVKLTGEVTSKDIDRAGFETVMGYFEYLGFRPMDSKAPRYGNRTGFASFAQIELIRELWREIHRASATDDEALAGWLLKYHKVSAMRFVTASMAQKIITALKHWKARERAKRQDKAA